MGRETEVVMHVIGRFSAIIAGAFALTAIGAAIAARAMKVRIIPVDSADAPEVTLRAIFEPIQFRSTSTMFRGGTLDCWFGGGLIDLRDAILDPDGARLEIRGIFGGGQILVPESWRVTTNVVGVGGIGDSRSQTQRPVTAPLLVIDGTVLFGGFGITSELSEEAVTAIADAVARRKGRSEAMAPDPEPAPVV
jgi:hypothetical protein